jgi:hypothetical protein
MARLASVLDRAGTRSSLDALVQVCLELFPVCGVSVAVVADGQHLGRLAVAGRTAAAVEDLQFSLGEGPCISAGGSLGPILEPDLTRSIGLWPAFAPAAVDLGVRAAFSFPLHVGAVRLGVLNLYRSEPGDLDAVDVADATAIARVASHLLIEIERDLPQGSLPDRLDDVLELRASIHQATGMVAAQLGVDVATALGRLRAFAWAQERSIVEVATEVIGRRLRFDEA